VAERRTCPICGNPVVVRVGIVERHAKNKRATFSRELGRPPRVQWCEASDKRWDDVTQAEA
jgi:hypothetical protein